MITIDVAKVRTRGRALLHIADALTAALAGPVPNATAYPYARAAGHLLVVPDGDSVVTLLVGPDAVVVVDDGPQLDMRVDGVAAVLARTAVADLVAADPLQVCADHTERFARMGKADAHDRDRTRALARFETAGRAAYHAGGMRAPTLSPLVREAIAGKAVGDPAVAAAMTAYTRGFDRAADEAAAAA